MAKPILEAAAILKHAAPLTHQTAHEIQPFGHLIRMPLALSEQTWRASSRRGGAVATACLPGASARILT